MSEEQHHTPTDQVVPETEKIEDQTVSRWRGLHTKFLANAKIGSTFNIAQNVSMRMFQLALFIVLALVVLSTIKSIATPKSGPEIEAFQIPESLQVAGLTGEIFAKKLLDRTIEKHGNLVMPTQDEGKGKINALLAMEKVISNPNIFKAINVERSKDLKETQDIQVPVPGMNLSLDALILTVLDAFGLKPESTQIGCEVTFNDSSAWMTVRISGKPVRTFQAEHIVETDVKVDELLDQGAEYVLETLYPLSVGIAYARSDPDSLDQLISEFWQNDPTQEERTVGFILEGLRSLVVEKDCEQALSRLELASANDVKNWLPYYFKAYIKLTCQKNNEEAEKEFNDVIKYTDENVEMLLIRGQFFYQLGHGKVADAEKEFEKALKLAPQKTSVEVRWADSLHDLVVNGEDPDAVQSSTDRALGLYRDANLLGPEYVESYVNWGDLLLAVSDSNASDLNDNEALAKYKEAIRYDPAYVRAYLKWAELLLSNGEGRKISEFEDFNRAIKKYKDSNEAVAEDSQCIGPDSEDGQCIEQYTEDPLCIEQYAEALLCIEQHTQDPQCIEQYAEDRLCIEQYTQDPLCIGPFTLDPQCIGPFTENPQANDQYTRDPQCDPSLSGGTGTNPGTNPGTIDDYTVMKNMRILQQTIAESAFQGVWEVAGKNATILKTKGNVWKIANSWKWHCDRVTLDFETKSSPFKPKAYFSPSDIQTMSLVDRRTLINDNFSVWDKYQAKDFEGRWEAKGTDAVIDVTVQNKPGGGFSTIFDISDFSLPKVVPLIRTTMGPN